VPVPLLTTDSDVFKFLKRMTPRPQGVPKPAKP
jgi:hypothetical protein